MSSRTLLKEQLARAWRETLLEIYPQQLINSERGLQVHFCHRLLSQFSSNSVLRRLFVEPCFVSEGRTLSPDIVVCNTKYIIGVLELKYLPRVRPDFEKDLNTLQWFSQQEAHTLTLSNERYLGSQADAIKTYSLAPDAVLCWAGVYRGPDETRLLAEAASSRSLGSRFLALHAVTSDDGHPQLLPTKAFVVDQPASS